jgi:flagellin-like hook-associated protein FlgL
MRIPNLNVSESLTRTIRDLEMQRLKLDQQISTGQKISLPEDDGMRVGRVIQLDSEKGKLAQYQRNASYATEFVNAGHTNLDKLRELNLRAQEIARMAGNSLSEPAVEGFILETDQLIEEALNRINASQRGRSLFGGTETKPNFTNSEIILGELQRNVLNLDKNLVGKEAAEGVRYLKQGDEVSITLNGVEYTVSAKVLNQEDFDPSKTYSKGALVKITQVEDDSIQTNLSVDPNDLSGTETIEGLLSDLKSDVITDWSTRDWSSQPVGKTSTGEDVYLLDLNQIQSISAELDKQPNVDRMPTVGGYYTLTSNGNTLFLEPVEKVIDDSDQSSSFVYTDGISETYWEASTSGLNGSPFDGVDGWIESSPFNRISDLSSSRAVELLKEMVNTTYLTDDVFTEETVDYTLSVRPSSIQDNVHNPDLELFAKITEDGSLEISGSVGEQYKMDVKYFSRFDSENYFPNQLEDILDSNAKTLFPGVTYEELSQSDKDLVWSSVQNSKLEWALSAETSVEVGNSSMSINQASSWKRLEVYHRGDTVNYNGKIWESIANENFNHLPNLSDSQYWKELGSGYDVAREDWTITNTGYEDRFYFISPDGKLFENRLEAENHTLNLLISSSNRRYTDNVALFNDIDSLLKETSYAVPQFKVEGSESEGVVYFDSMSQTHRLGAFAEGDAAVSGVFTKGTVKNESDAIGVGDVVLKNGTYFLLLEQNPSFQATDGLEGKSSLDSTVVKGSKVFIPSQNKLFISLGSHLPNQGEELFIDETVGRTVDKGSFVYDRVTDKYYVATAGIYGATRNDLTINFNYLGSNYSPPGNINVTTLSESLPQNVSQGTIVQNSSTGEYFEALLDVEGVTNDTLIPKFVAASVFNAAQGSEWSANRTYNKGQIILYKGVYYECQTNGTDGTGFNNEVPDNSLLYATEPPPVLVRPDEQFYYDSSDTISKEYLDLQIARGEPIKNNVWLPVANSTQHLFSFETTNNSSSLVDIRSAGVSGQDAQTSVVTDVNGKVTGIHVTDPGRYFFNINESDGSVPEEYQQAKVLLPDGQSMKANIIWGENPNDPGPYIILGFELLEEAYIDQPTSSQKGDSFSFATGSKTFLDHRNSDGQVVGVTYTGSDENSEFYIGKDTKISSFLDAEDGNTAELANVLESLIELREGLSEDSPSELSRRVQLVESELIQREDEVVDKLGELSSLLIRMESVRAYDEDYHLQLEQRLAKDLDIDLSQAIMELTRVSTAYQAAMQVGAQLLNTSLLNYI